MQSQQQSQLPRSPVNMIYAKVLGQEYRGRHHRYQQGIEMRMPVGAGSATMKKMSNADGSSSQATPRQPVRQIIHQAVLMDRTVLLAVQAVVAASTVAALPAIGKTRRLPAPRAAQLKENMSFTAYLILGLVVPLLFCIIARKGGSDS